MQSIRTQIYLPAWLKEAIQKAAKKKGVNTSEYIRDVLKEAIKQEEKQDIIESD